MPTTVFQQIREVSAGTIQASATGEADDVDMAVAIQRSRDAPLTFEVTFKNLSDSTWGGVSKGDPCQISLGWEETEAPTVCFGEIGQARAESDALDTNYIVSGEDASSRQLNHRFSKTFDTRTPSDIASSLAVSVGLSPAQVDSAAVPIEGYYSISRERPVRYWLDELATEAAKRTGSQWEWFALAGKFHFVRKDSSFVEVIELSDTTPQNLLSISEATGQSKKTGGGQELEFEAICLPSLTKNTVVSVDTSRFSGEYSVVEYAHDSDTTTGDHKTTGTLVSVTAEYDAVGDDAVSLPAPMSTLAPGTGLGL